MDKQIQRFSLEKKDISILLVDDSPTQLFEAKYYLEKEGYEVISAVDGVDALKKIEQHEPTIVITDIVMPKMDGYELCEKIKSNPKTLAIPVVLLTALNDPKDIVKSIKSGANKFITKPLNIKKMNDVISELMFNLENRKKQRLDVGIKILFEGEEHTITSDKVQLLDLLISSYESAYSKNIELIETQEKLEKLNLELESKVEQRTRQIKDKDKMLLAQSRQAAMGDMIAMIAHQWRQPIAIISMIANNVMLDIELENDINKESLKKDMEGICLQSQHLSDTIDDFRNFFKPNKEKIKIELSKIIENTLDIMGKSFENNDIQIQFDKESFSNVILTIFDQELKQVLLNILSNSKDAIKSRNIKSGKITIYLEKEKDFVKIVICDNGGGIPLDIIDKIGEPYLTTKSKNGTGLGIYMSKIVVEKHLNGDIYWENKDDGVCFTIKLPSDEKGSEQ